MCAEAFLQKATNIDLSNILLVLEPPFSDQPQNTFDVITASDTVHLYFQASSKSQRDKWMNAISFAAAVEKVNFPPTTAVGTEIGSEALSEVQKAYDSSGNAKSLKEKLQLCVSLILADSNTSCKAEAS